MNQPEITAAKVKDKARSLGFDRVGIAAAVSGTETERLQTWLAMGYHADMAWMHNPKRQDISLCLPGVKSVICVALNYYTKVEHSEDGDRAKISRYGWGRDYHRVLGKRLKALSRWLESLADDITTRYYVDTGPIAEKAWAQRAGIGWIGKHSNIISRDYGSWLFLGEVLTNLELETDRPHAEHCGSCTRCIEACPTNAIAQPFVVDANRCIAYHTIENRAEQIPEAITANLNNWVAGCDICQDVCPWNQRFAKETTIADFQPYPDHVAPKLAELAELSEPSWDENLTGSALRRIKLKQWQRNAQAIIDRNGTHKD
ncbi:iron-sulfur cluster binding protein [Thalassoporum mexicanum PCC 7367]|uniref:tRNA epoxyqueuosine(34) reductase QueG n=1 Tax=Thalassoporum mexicanum TaxID=3457544 RepID=UPI00029F960C|nr:tRNA epoxyqueuosine(34) reductase QueG [Pseudanabaena sp. PCC 7367]AFY71739.1 iron-sulfur cluster binding protein [Pseudanabaena sp. PCC 7367]